MRSNTKCFYPFCLEGLNIPWGKDKQLGWSFLGKCPITNLFCHPVSPFLYQNTFVIASQVEEHTRKGLRASHPAALARASSEMAAGRA